MMTGYSKIEPYDKPTITNYIINLLCEIDPKNIEKIEISKYFDNDRHWTAGSEPKINFVDSGLRHITIDIEYWEPKNKDRNI